MARIIALMTALQIVGAEAYSDQRPTVVLEGNAAVVGIDLLGGSIADFRLRGSDLNPLSWGRDRAGDGPAAMGHFLCLDRWASASRAEAGNGMPGHGEASAVAWQVLRGPERRDGFIEVEMAATLPLANFEVRRPTVGRTYADSLLRRLDAWALLRLWGVRKGCAKGCREARSHVWAVADWLVRGLR